MFEDDPYALQLHALLEHNAFVSAYEHTRQTNYCPDKISQKQNTSPKTQLQAQMLFCTLNFDTACSQYFSWIVSNLSAKPLALLL